MKVTDATAQILAALNVTHGFELIGGMITHLVDSISSLGKTKLISVRHEQSAAFAAAAIARATNHEKLGVALATSGPGATNLITGIADCWLDSHPCIFITGQVNTHELKGDLAIRQQGFQELDIVSIVKSITKYAVQISNPNEIPGELVKAINIATEGRAGPVLIDIPMNIQRAEIEDNLLAKALEQNLIQEEKKEPSVSDHHEHKFQHIIYELNKAAKPLFLLGGGAVNNERLKQLTDKLMFTKIPYVTSLKGAEKVHASEVYLGMVGAYGTRIANYAVQNCDLLIILGSRLDTRQTGAKVESFAKHARLIQVDIDPAQLNNRVPSVGVCAKVENFIDYFSEYSCIDKKTNWSRLLSTKRKQLCVDEYPSWRVSPFALFNILSHAFKNKPVQYVADVGNNQMWAAHSLSIYEGQACHYSGGLGAMGFAIPSAIGVHLATNKMVVAICGDGGIQLNIQELDVIARENLPILILLLNNYSLGMVKTFQDLYFDGRSSSTYWNGYSCDFQEISNGYRVTSRHVTDVKGFEAAVTEFINTPKPTLVEVAMYGAYECRPRLEYGNELDKQSPPLGSLI